MLSSIIVVGMYLVGVWHIAKYMMDREEKLVWDIERQRVVNTAERIIRGGR